METFRNILLTEGARDRALEQFIPLLQQRGIQMSVSQLKQFLLDKFVTQGNIHNLSLDSNFYLLGVARYYFNGDLTSNKQLNILYPRVTDRFIPDVCQKLDALILILRNAYIDSVGTTWEQPEDFGTLSIKQLFRKYGAKINRALGLDVKPKEELPVKKPKVSNNYKAGRNYTYEIMYSQEDCKKYCTPTSPGAWCITYGQQHYNNYIKMFKRYGGIHYVVFRQNGYENIPRRVGTGFTKRKPHDAYGNSLICVLQRNDCPEPTFITSRWNHGYGSTQGTEADHAYTKEEFFEVVGCDQSVLDRAYEQWKVISGNEDKKAEEKAARKEEQAATKAEKLAVLRAFKYMQMLINGGANPFKIELDGFEISFNCFGWDYKEWSESRNGGQPITKDNAPQKFPYFVYIRQQDSSNRYCTIMDRKQLMFDKFLELRTYNYPTEIDEEGDNFSIVIGADYVSYMYDKRRHTVLDIDGVTKFKWSYSICEDRTHRKNIKYVILAKSANEMAMVDTSTMKPVKARNGAVWFEAIVGSNSSTTSNVSRGYTNFDWELKDHHVVKLIYDSSAGEVYFYNLDTHSLIDPMEDVPDGWYPIYESGSIGNHLPYDDCLMLTTSQEASQENNPYLINGSGKNGINFMFKNLTTGEFFHIDDKYEFKEFYCLKRPSHSVAVATYMLEGSEDVFYYDVERKKHLEFNGNPIRTKYHVDIMAQGGYAAISFSKWTLDAGGEIRMGNYWSKCMLYNMISGEFYNDKYLGYMFNIYGGYDEVKVVIPDNMLNKIPRNLIVSDDFNRVLNLYSIPSADITADMNDVDKTESEPLPFDESRDRLLNIIRETIIRELNIPL